MEVHHTHSHGKKNWKQYFWEFLMLFLAVFCGFLAENLREHISDRKKEKVYIESLVSDIKKDTSVISGVTKTHFKLLRGQDSLIDALNNYNNSDSMTRKCYSYYFQYATAQLEVVFSERTMSQLLNSGNMRLIHKQSVSDQIMDYNEMVKYVQSQGIAYQDYFNKALDFSGNIFDFGYTRNTLNDDYTIKPKFQPGKVKFKFLSKDPAVFKKYSNDISLVVGVLETYMFYLKAAKEKAIRLIALLKNEYHLK